MQKYLLKKRFKTKHFKQNESFGEFTRMVNSWLTQYMNDMYYELINIQYIQVDKELDLWNVIINYYELTE